MKTLFIALSLFIAMSAAADHHGKILTNSSGMTLYTFDKDADGASNCYGGCAVKWPPHIAKQGATVNKPWGLTTRKDGAQQWTYNNQPLYTWVGDSKAGDTTGNGVGGVWHTAEKAKKKAKHGY
ncbi:MAG: putative lipoprotein with Yx(FWY)xxD motif [Candidatus Endobugula sp.]|jgi:predicted lipoprotein with Yx(FWY)xxD motif